MRPFSRLLVTLACFISAMSLAAAPMARPGRARSALSTRRRVPAWCLGDAVVRSSSHVRVTLADRVLHYEVDETFVNRGGRLGEADYIFPLPHGAAFAGMQLSINGELVSGETMDATHARSIYEEIVRRQRDPALVEWMGYGMLHARIFPILPRRREARRRALRSDRRARG